MNTYLIDFKRPSGAVDFACVEAATPEDATRIFHSAGRDGWYGYDYSEYKIIACNERI